MWRRDGGRQFDIIPDDPSFEHKDIDPSLDCLNRRCLSCQYLPQSLIILIVIVDVVDVLCILPV